MTAILPLASRFPHPPFPDSWYAVAWSSEVPSGLAVPVRAFGRELVAFRSGSGAVHVLDAYCPHMGAHLGHGGRVVDDHLQCPFHGWRFSTDGRCTAAPTAKKLPTCAPLGTWPVRELHGRVWVWFSSVGAAPAWSLPEVLLDPGRKWAASGELERTFPSHPQDIVENAVDPLHFLFIHGMTELLESETVYQEHSLRTRLRVRTGSKRFGFPGIALSGTVTVNIYGMGLQTIETVMVADKLGLHSSTLVVEGITPRDAGTASLLIDLHMVPLRMPGVTWLAQRAFLKAVAFDVDADVQIWTNRRYLPRPLLTSADGEIARYRQWARSFYPEQTARS